MTKQRYSSAEVIAACDDSAGVMAVVARKLGCDRATVLNYAKRYPTVRAALDQADEAATDEAESKSIELIRALYWPAIEYRLKTKGRKRGYIERTEHELTGPDGGPIKTEDVTLLSDEELARRVKALLQSVGDKEG